MTRSYAAALVFIEARVIPGLLGIDGSIVAAEVIVLMCVILAVPLADIVLNWHELRRPNVQKAQAAAEAA